MAVPQIRETTIQLIACYKFCVVMAIRTRQLRAMHAAQPPLFTHAPLHQSLDPPLLATHSVEAWLV